MRIRTKVLSGFVVVTLVTVILGVVGLISTVSLDNLTTELYYLQKENDSISRVLDAHNMWRQGLTEAVLLDKEFTGSLDATTCSLGQWYNSEEARNMSDPELLDLLAKLNAPHSIIHGEAKTTVALIADDKLGEARDHLVNSILPHTAEVISILTEMQNKYINLVAAKNTESVETANMTKIITAVLMGVSVIFSVFLSLIISGRISKQIVRLVDVTGDVAQGNLNVNIDISAKDESGQLAVNISKLVQTFKTLLSDLSYMSDSHDKGDIDIFMDSSKFSGEYAVVSDKVNYMVSEHINTKKRVVAVYNQMADGNFEAQLPKLPGKKVFLNEAIDNMREKLENVNREINKMVDSAINGDLSVRANTSAYKGGWERVIGGLNRLMDTVSTPVNEILSVMRFLAQGGFKNKMNGDYKGDFLALKESVNATVSNIASYIDEISLVLVNMARHDLNQQITRDYVGDFELIKKAMNDIINTFNTVISDITLASEQVAAGARSISESSMALATGATEQASSVEELNATVAVISENTNLNAGNARSAETLSNNSKNNAGKGDQDMKDMLKSMNGIKESSNKISKIIRVIEDIAFQTNLLALNAAVEAARAGEQGAGFSVVADEVRSLAIDSQAAAKETAELIAEAIERVEEGMTIADKTADTLGTIVSDIDKVAGLITNIANASGEQAEAVEHVVIGLNQITNVVQSNSATSEESASASQELSSQAEVMRNLVSVFKLRD